MANGVGVGVDVSKDTLDLATSDGALVGRFRNDSVGLAQLTRELSGLVIRRVLLEASGGYEREALISLFRAGLPVVLIQPLRARHFAKALGRYAKTDAIDAFMLARMAELVVSDVPLWEPTEETLADLKALVERRQVLLTIRDAEQKRLRLARDIIRPDLEASVDELTTSIRDVERRIDALLAHATRLREEVAVLEGVVGVGRISAAAIRVSLPELGTVTRGEIAALAGIAPLNRDSGGWSGQRFIRGGRPDARRSLYMAALAATRWNPIIRERYRSLVASGKKPKVALVACMRKLLIHLNSRMRDHLAGPTDAAPQLS
jgi:transposase